jgi:hypothetical protein
LPAADPIVPTIPVEQLENCPTSGSAASNSSVTPESLVRPSAEVSIPSSGQLDHSMLAPSDSSTGSRSRDSLAHSYGESAIATLSDRKSSFQALDFPVETVLLDNAAGPPEQRPSVSPSTLNHSSHASSLEQSQPPVRCRAARCEHLSKSKKAEM